jgi:ribose transport system substrate-binding protein
MHRIRNRVLAALVGVTSIALVAGCAGSSSSASSSSASTTSGKQIVYFGPSPTGNSYVGLQQQAFSKEAAQLGFTVKYVLNNVDPEQEGQQIQQFVASGQTPAAFVLWPLDTQTGVEQAAQLSRVAPVFQINFAVAPGGFQYVKAFVGANDESIGETMAQNLLQLRAKVTSEGNKLHSAEGNLLVIGPPAGIEAPMVPAMLQGVSKQPFNVLQNVDCCADSQPAYTEALQLLSKWKGQVDFIATFNGDTASGIVKAAQQVGLTPGKNVWIVDGNCGGPGAPLLSGQVYATSEQLPNIEGAAMVQTIARYLATKKVLAGTAVLPMSKSVPALADTPPTQINYLPNPPLVSPSAAAVQQVVWGETLTQGCPLN